MFKNGSFPPDSSGLQAYLEGTLSGIRFEITSVKYGSEESKAPRTQYARNSLERTEKMRYEDIVYQYIINGTYNNGMKFSIPLIRNIDIEGSGCKKTKDNLALVGNYGTGWPDLGNGITSYTTYAYGSEGHISTAVIEALERHVDYPLRNRCETKDCVIDFLYPDNDYTKQAVTFVPRNPGTQYKYVVERFPTSSDTLHGILGRVVPGIKFDIRESHTPLLPRHLETPERKDFIVKLSIRENTTIEKLIDSYDVIGRYSNGMCFTFALGRGFSMTRPGRSRSNYVFENRLSLVREKDPLRVGDVEEYNRVLSTTFARVAVAFGISDIKVDRSGYTSHNITPATQRLIDDYPNEDYTTHVEVKPTESSQVQNETEFTDTNIRPQIAEAPVSSSSNSSLIVRSLTATIEEAAAANVVLEERNRLLELEISNLRIQTLELTSRNASMNEKFTSEVQRVTSEMKSKIETEHRETLSTILVEKDLAIRAFQRERATHNETRKQLETTTAKLSFLETSVLNSAMEKNDLKEELRKKELERQSFLSWFNSSPLNFHS